MRRFGVVASVAALIGALGACSSSEDAKTVAITATDSECRAATTELGAGRQSFRVTNKGDKVTEVYVYGENDRVVTEKEDIGPGTSASFAADLTAGSYEIACKPGQTGSGIRQRITVTGAGGAAPKPADRQVKFHTVDYAFAELGGFTARAGETVEFQLQNEGTTDHEFEVFPPEGDALGEIGPTPPGAAGAVTLTLEKPGTYRYVCGVEDHEARGMTGTFVVT